MDQATQYAQMLNLLQALENELRKQNLWSGTPPDAKAMSSVLPFMYDTLKVHEWLQWVFIPRTRAVIDARKNLPGNCNIHPLAEYEFTKLKNIDSSALLVIILDIDTVMSSPL